MFLKKALCLTYHTKTMNKRRELVDLLIFIIWVAAMIALATIDC